MIKRQLFRQLNRALLLMSVISVTMPFTAVNTLAAEETVVSEAIYQEAAEPFASPETVTDKKAITDTDPSTINQKMAGEEHPNGELSNGELPNAELPNGELPEDELPDALKDDARSDYIFSLDDFFMNEAFLLYGSSRVDAENESEFYDEPLELCEVFEEDIQAYSTRTTSQEGIDLIKKWEGFRSKAYKALSTEKYYTIGYGHNGPDVTADMVITLEQGEALLRQDVKSFENSLNSFCRTNDVFLSQNQFDALISFSYNVGTSWMKDSTIRRYILEGFDKHSDQDYKDALYMWRYSGGKEIAGLANRRIAEGELFVKYRIVTEANGLKLTVESPRIIGCRTQTNFILKCEGGSGSYQYKINSLRLYDGSEYSDVYDTSYGNNGSFKTMSSFPFTFYASGDYYISFSVKDVSKGVAVSMGAYDMPLMVRASNCPTVQETVTAIADSCKRNCTTEYEKALWLHDYLVLNAQPDSTGSFCYADGVLSRGKGTSKSYCSAYSMLLKAVGMQSKMMSGNGHDWNAVRINNKWYHVDTALDDMTAADTSIDVKHLYFGLTDDIMKQVHSEHTPDALAKCTDLDKNYFISSGDITKWSDPYKKVISDAISGGDVEIETGYIANGTKGKYDNVLLPLILYELQHTDFDGRKLVITQTENGYKAAEQISAPVVKKAYLQLKGRTVLVFKMAIPESLRNVTTAYGELSCNGHKKQIYIKDLVADKGLIDFPYDLSAKELGDKVTIKIYKNSLTPVAISNANAGNIYNYSYSVGDYVAAVNDSIQDAGLQSMLDALMNYGKCAEIYFDDIGEAAPEAVESVKYSNFMPYEYDMTGAVSGIKYIGSTLLLEEDTSIRHYFEIEAGRSFNEYSFTIDGKEADIYSQGNQCCVEINDILPVDYGKMVKVCVSKDAENMTIGYSVYAYGERALYKQSASEGIANVMRAMYLYGEASKKYYTGR